MDRAFIENNQIVERYLAGKLPYKGAQDFERYCAEHPQLLDQLKLGEHISAGIRLMEVSGRPPGWQEPRIAWWKRWETLAGLAALCLALLVTLWVLGVKYANRKEHIVDLERRLVQGPLLAPSSTRTIRVIPDRAGPGGTPAVSLSRASPPELVELRIDVSFAPFRSFTLVADSVGHARVGTVHNVARDSNGELRLALNSSALRAGDYSIAIEGVPMRGRAVPVAWLTVRVAE